MAGFKKGGLACKGGVGGDWSVESQRMFLSGFAPPIHPYRPAAYKAPPQKSTISRAATNDLFCCQLI